MGISKDNGKCLSHCLSVVILTHSPRQDRYILGATSVEGTDTLVDEFGIVKGHAYSILRVVEV
jgi:hypothetical protein